MKIDEAIEKHKIMKKASELHNDKMGVLYSAEEHEQLADWLEELKALRNGLKIKCDSLNDALEKGKKVGYKKAIDDFKKMLTIKKIKEYAESDGFININNCSLMILDIAEQLKAGVNV